VKQLPYIESGTIEVISPLSIVGSSSFLSMFFCQNLLYILTKQIFIPINKLGDTSLTIFLHFYISNLDICRMRVIAAYNFRPIQLHLPQHGGQIWRERRLSNQSYMHAKTGPPKVKKDAHMNGKGKSESIPTLDRDIKCLGEGTKP